MFILLVEFHQAVMESLLKFSITVWYDSTTQKQKVQLDRVQSMSSAVCDIVGDTSSPASGLFVICPLRTRIDMSKLEHLALQFLFQCSDLIEVQGLGLNADCDSMMFAGNVCNATL